MFSTYQVNNKQWTNLCFIVISDEKSTNKIKHEQKRLKNAKKVFLPAFGCRRNLKAGKNTQQGRLHMMCMV